MQQQQQSEHVSACAAMDALFEQALPTAAAAAVPSDDSDSDSALDALLGCTSALLRRMAVAADLELLERTMQITRARAVAAQTAERELRERAEARHLRRTGRPLNEPQGAQFMRRLRERTVAAAAPPASLVMSDADVAAARSSRKRPRKALSSEEQQHRDDNNDDAAAAAVADEQQQQHDNDNDNSIVRHSVLPLGDIATATLRMQSTASRPRMLSIPDIVRRSSGDPFAVRMLRQRMQAERVAQSLASVAESLRSGSCAPNAEVAERLVALTLQGCERISEAQAQAEEHERLVTYHTMALRPMWRIGVTTAPGAGVTMLQAVPGLSAGGSLDPSALYRTSFMPTKETPGALMYR